MTGHRSSPELVTLQAVRLAGMADDDAVQDRALVGDVQGQLARAGRLGWVERHSFADLAGWTLTQDGATRLAALLASDLADAGAAGPLEEALDRFEPVNATFVGVVSRWQLRSTQATADGFAGADEAEVTALLQTLADVGGQLRGALSGLIPVLPRFGRYPAQYDLALDRARTEGQGWVTGVGLLSCHTVWAELHQDLLSSLGRGR